MLIHVETNHRIHCQSHLSTRKVFESLKTLYKKSKSSDMAANFSDQTEGNHVSSTAIRRTPLTIAVEINIGSGKSTFLAYCESRCNVAVFPEPIAQWRNVRGENLLVKSFHRPVYSI